MREILFKAKRKDNGEWIEGSLIDLDIDSGYGYPMRRKTPCFSYGECQRKTVKQLEEMKK